VNQKKFKVVFTPAAERDIEKLEADVALRLVRDLKTYLETAPFPIGKTRVKKLTDFDPPLYRLRSGEFRAYYRIISQKVIILAITHKKDSQEILRKIKR